MKRTNIPTSSSFNASAPAWSFWLWATAAFAALFIFVILGTAWAVRHAFIGGSRLSAAQARLIIGVAEYPGRVYAAINELHSRLGGDPLPLLIDRKATETPSWVRHFPASEDPGYLLFSGVDPVAKQSVVKLIRISDGEVLARWDPDWTSIYQKITSKKFAIAAGPSAARAIHPLLLPDGSIVFNTPFAMVRMHPCSPEPLWVLDDVLHHSNELDQNGDIWTPSVSQDGLAENTWLHENVRDDALARVSPDGRLLEQRSFARIMRDNGLQSLLLGITGVKLNNDPIHLNQIQIALHESRYWKQGDLLISARHLSTVFLYRPSTGKIIWHQTGPWMNQHSVDFVNDHQISIFDNNVIASAPKEHAFMTPGETNRVFLYDFSNGQLSQPYAALLAQARPVTLTEGRARVLPDGGLFLEETNYGRDLRFTRDKLLWSRVNDYDDKRIGMVSWSRYLTAEEARGPLLALAARKCSSAAAK
jgi:hypothetical protein